MDNGFVKILGFSGQSRTYKSGKKRRLWSAECMCSKVFLIHSNDFHRGIPRSCGCRKNEGMGNTKSHTHSITHGFTRNYSKHGAYSTWLRMKSRCYTDKRSRIYNAYVVKGITVCEEWLNDASKFIHWALANGWEKGLSIDRIDPSKGYSPDNCQFITHSQNSAKVHVDNPGFQNGEKNHSAKLNVNQVKEIKKLLLLGIPNCTISTMLNIKKHYVSDIKGKRTWKHID